ncbi:mast cell protease 1A-like [Bufo bufo]|uniref:mast cell protease 1A-like n=1 Tax=Bufo bufo TaxID=8384 RepID=UPI001ABECFB9|nr:mast cell protease 1A-like [Bufo bufo]
MLWKHHKMEHVQVILVIFASSVIISTPCAEKFHHEIIGGHEVDPHSRPYIAYLKIDSAFCGGSLIAPGWVLSAAHCYGNIVVILGAHDVTQPEETQQIIGVESYHLHPEYDDEAAMPFNDVMLLKLSSSAEINKYVQTIPLPSSTSDLPKNTPCSIAGWGLIDKNQVTDKLFETNITIVSRRFCRRYYPGLTNGMICAGSHKKITDSSQGDSGGPLVCNGALEGIVSFGYHHPPGVYARVGEYLEWIKQTISQYDSIDI